MCWSGLEGTLGEGLRWRTEKENIPPLYGTTLSVFSKHFHLHKPNAVYVLSLHAIPLHGFQCEPTVCLRDVITSQRTGWFIWAAPDNGVKQEKEGRKFFVSSN